MSKGTKVILTTALVSIITIAIISRVPKIRQIVLGA